MFDWMQKLFAVLALHKTEQELDVLDEDLAPKCLVCGTALPAFGTPVDGHRCPLCGFDL